MTIYTVWIINKSGGLIYQRTLVDGFHPKLTSNDYLVIASTFQSVYAISAQISPPGAGASGGVESIEWHGTSSSGGSTDNSYMIHCLHVPTGLKFLVTASPNHSQHDVTLRKVYELYADYALKNPFYTPEMPIRCELFDVNLSRHLQHS